MLILALDEVIDRIRKYIALKAPSGRNIGSFMNWTRAHKPLTKEESTFLEHTDDFVALANGQENGWLDGFVEDTMNWCLPSNLMKVAQATSFSFPDPGEIAHGRL